MIDEVGLQDSVSRLSVFFEKDHFFSRKWMPFVLPASIVSRGGLLTIKDCDPRDR